MQLWVVGDEQGKLGLQLARHLAIEVQSGAPDSVGNHIVVVSQPAPEEVIKRARTLVLVEPELEDRDRLTRLLSGTDRPHLEIVANVGAGIRAERSWALLLAMAAGIPHAASALSTHPVPRSDLVTGSPPGGSWIDLDRPRSLFGHTIGFVGFSPMGWKMAELAAQVGMRPIYWPEPGSSHIEIEGAALRSGAAESAFDVLLAA
jgi:phosphoglycerate dehydrogenase-like enzyme